MFKEVEPREWECHRKLGIEPFATGYDSQVYRDGDFVVKAYKGYPVGEGIPLTESQFNLYRWVTDSTFRIAETEGLPLKLIYSNKTILLRVNPILSARMCDCGCVEARSKYIAGNDLEYLPHVFDSKELVIGLRDINRLLENRLFVLGINLVPINLKTEDGQTVIVTDLCSDVSKLRPKLRHL